MFNLNCDNLLELSGFNLEDGFTKNYDDFQAYSSRDFEAALKDGTELHCHLHGSILYGYSRHDDFITELVKYPTAHLALDSLEGISVSGTNVKGSNVTGRPLISGFNKLAKLHYSQAPYRAYFRAFAEKLSQCHRLLIIGYGGYDDHVNSLLGGYMDQHGQSKRVVYVLPRKGINLEDRPTKADRLMLEIAHPTDFIHSPEAWYDEQHHPVEFSTHGNLGLCAAGFPLKNNKTIEEAMAFLAT